MATTQNPLIGAASGSVGGVTFTKWKGINVIKTKPTSVAQPASDARSMQQSALTQIVAIYRLISAVIALGFKSLAIGKSEYNAFSSYNLKNAFDFSAPPTATLSPDSLLISKGTISPTMPTGLVADVSDGSLTVNWTNSVQGANQSLTDKAIVVAYNTTQDVWESVVTTVPRSEGAYEMPINHIMVVGDEFRVYLGFVSVSGNLASDSNVQSVVAQA